MVHSYSVASIKSFYSQKSIPTSPLLEAQCRPHFSGDWVSLDKFCCLGWSTRIVEDGANVFLWGRILWPFEDVTLRGFPPNGTIRETGIGLELTPLPFGGSHII